MILLRGYTDLFTIYLVLSCLTVPALAEGNPNIDGENGGIVAGTESAYWTANLQGVRISVYDIKGKRVRATADYSNMTNEQIHSTYCGKDIADNWFGYVPKTTYMRGLGLSLQSGEYTVRNFRQNGKVVTFLNCINSNDTTNFGCTAVANKKIRGKAQTDFPPCTVPLVHIKFKEIFFIYFLLCALSGRQA